MDKILEKLVKLMEELSASLRKSAESMDKWMKSDGFSPGDPGIHSMVKISTIVTNMRVALQAMDAVYNMYIICMICKYDTVNERNVSFALHVLDQAITFVSEVLEFGGKKSDGRVLN